MIAAAERILVAVVFCLLAYLYVGHLQEKRAEAETAAASARADVASRDLVIGQLRDQATQRALAAGKLQGERDAIRAQLGTREIEMRKLQDENADVRAWAVAAVPGPVAGMHSHPAFTGAAAYREFLSKGAGLPAAGGARGQ